MLLTERQRPPNRRESITHKIEVNTRAIFITISFDKDERICEIFFNTSKEGSELRALFGILAMSASVALQHGASVAELIHMYRSYREEPIVAQIIEILNNPLERKLELKDETTDEPTCAS